MAKVRFVNITDTVQVVYDEGMNKYEVIPGGSVVGEEGVFNNLGCLRKEVEVKEFKSAKKPLVEDAKK